MEITWEEIEQLVSSLSGKVREYSPDIVIAIAMGAWIPARLLKNHYKADYYSIGCSYYDENNQKTDKVRIIQDLNIDIAGKKVLILDEVADSGDTMQKVYDYIKGKGPTELRTAVLHTKSCSKFTPDITVKNVGDEWLVYPWEK